jgi:hypothetical protein
MRANEPGKIRFGAISNRAEVLGYHLTGYLIVFSYVCQKAESKTRLKRTYPDTQGECLAITS